MRLSDLSIRRPVFATVMSLILLLAGLVAYTTLSVREYPRIDPPVISIETVYRGAAANVVESRITQILEDAVSGLEGIETISSRSRDGRSEISIEFKASRNIDDAANDVRDRIGTVGANLPEEAEPPTVRKVDSDAQPIMYFQLAGEGWTPMQLTDYADRYIVDRLASVDGVARVVTGGDARPSMRVWLNPEKLAALALTPNDVETALRAQNLELPAGRIETATTNLTVRLNRAFYTPQDFANLVVRRGDDGYLVRLGDVARVETGAENPYSIFRANGAPAFGIGIVRQSNANTLEVAEAAKARVAEINAQLPKGLHLDYGLDSSVFIASAISNVWKTLAEAAILVVLVIFLFLGSVRATFIPAITVPICLVATFLVLAAFGMSINLLTLLALVLAIGLVVDDAIVVLENIYHRIEAGETPLVAAYRGTRQVGFAVIASTVVVCAVFVPVMFIAGNTGMLFRELAVAMIGALAFSGFVALSLTPMLCAKMLRAETGHNRLTLWVDRYFARLSAAYSARLSQVLARPRTLMLGTLAFVILSFSMSLLLKSELAPEEDTGNFNISVQLPESTSFAALSRYMLDVEKIILPYTGEEEIIRRALVRAPASFGVSEDFSSGRLIIFMSNWDERDQSTRELVDELNVKLRAFPSVRASANVSSALARGRSQPVQFVIAGDNYEELARARDALLARAAQYPGLVDLDSDYKETKPQLRIDIDTARAGDLGVSIQEIGRTLETMLGTRRATTYVDRGEEYRVILQADAQARQNIADIGNVYVRSQSGALIPISNLVTIRPYAEAGDLGRFNKLRAITISGNLGPDTSLGEALDWLDAEAATLPQVAQVGYRGESLSYKQTGASIYIVFALTILLVYLVLAAQFESFIHPGIIILTVPLAVGGGILGLVVMQGTLNLYSQIGIVMLIGLAAKNGILIVEFANQLRDAGKDVTTAIQEAAQRRLRPIVMTAIATVAGAVPLMLAGGAGAAARSAIGVVIVWGVSLATLLTLFLIPVMYNLLARRTGSPEAVARQLQAELARQGESQEEQT